MTFEEAIVASIRAYYKGIDPEQYNETRDEPIKYTREYFDMLEQKMVDENSPKKKSKKKAAEDDSDAA